MRMLMGFFITAVSIISLLCGLLLSGCADPDWIEVKNDIKGSFDLKDSEAVCITDLTGESTGWTWEQIVKVMESNTERLDNGRGLNNDGYTLVEEVEKAAIECGVDLDS